MEQPIYDQVIRALQGSKQRWPEVAKGSGVPVSTLRKIAQRHISNPGIHHVQALYDYFRVEAPQLLGASQSSPPSPASSAQQSPNRGANLPSAEPTNDAPMRVAAQNGATAAGGADRGAANG